MTNMRRCGVGIAAILTAGVPGPLAAEEFSLWVRSGAHDYLLDMISSFEAETEHSVDLQVVPVNEMVQKYAISSAGGSAPDALSLDLIYTPAFAESGELRDLTEFAQGLPYLEHLSPPHLSVGTVDGRIYGMPFVADPSLLFWNKDLYRDAGLDPDEGPQTWAEIDEHARAIGALGPETYGFYFSGNCGGCNIYSFAPLIWAAGGDLLSEEGRQARLDTPEVRGAIELYRGMVTDGLVPPGAATDSGANFFSVFAGGNIGITPLGSFAIKLLNERHPGLDYGVGFLPGREAGDWASFSGGDNIVVPAATDDAKMPAIEAFMEHIYSPQGQRILATHNGVPVRSDIAAEVLDGLDPQYALSTEAMAQGRTPYSVVFNDIINSNNGPWTTMLNRAFFAETAEEAAEAVADGQDEMQAIIDRAY